MYTRMFVLVWRRAEHWQMVRERESAEAERQAMRKEVADRMYEKVKREMEEEMKRWAG